MTDSDDLNPDVASHLADRAAEKRECIRTIVAVIDALEATGGKLDDWERVHLVEAVAAVFRGTYKMGAIQAWHATIPPNGRGAGPELPNDEIYERADLAMLRVALQEAEAEPVWPFAQFGPLIPVNS